MRHFCAKYNLTKSKWISKLLFNWWCILFKLISLYWLIYFGKETINPKKNIFFYKENQHYIVFHENTKKKRNYMAFFLLQSKSIHNDNCKNFSFNQLKNLLYLFYHPTLQYTKTPNINDSIFLTLLLNILSLLFFILSFSLCLPLL